MKHFIHRERKPSDPEFLREERRFLDKQGESLHLMEREREELARDIENARREAHRLGISLEHAPESGYRAWLALIGVGNRFRSDDAAGIEVARRLRATRPPGIRVLEEEGEPASLIRAFELMKEVLIVDAVSTGGNPGDLYRFEATHQPLPAETFRSSSHALGVGDAIELARQLDRLPPRLVVYGIEAESFETGEGLTPAVAATVDALVNELHEELGGGETSGMTDIESGDIEVIKRMLDAVAQADRDAFLGFLTEDVEWDDREGWPGVRKLYRGRQGVSEWWDAFKRVGGEVRDIEIENITPTPDSRVLLCVLGTFRSTADPASEFKARAWYVFWLRDRRVRRAQLFWDRPDAAAAAGIA